MNYIDEIAYAICAESDPGYAITETDKSLYRIYAVLCLAKGDQVTLEDVHDAWSAWQAGVTPDHKSLKPFGELDPHVQEMDRQYAEAIRVVARRR